MIVPVRAEAPFRALGLACLVLGMAGNPSAALEITGVRAAPSGAVPRFAKLEVTFRIAASVATTMQWPYDPAPPVGIPPGTGITVSAVFTDPGGTQFAQPAFYSEVFLDDERDGRDWHLPTGVFAWKVRFSPNLEGTWTYKIVAVDRSGTAESGVYRFTVTDSASRGFIRVSDADPRYFEFDDGTPFNAMGLQLPDFLGNPSAQGTAAYARLAAHGVTFARVWVSSIYGSAWNNWVGGRNRYRGYLPVTGLVPVADSASGPTTLAMQLDYEPAGDTGWFDACRMQFWGDQAESIKPNTSYRLRVRYRATGIAGPRRADAQDYGLVAKLGEGWHPDCYEPGTATPVTGYGGNTAGAASLEGLWFSGNRSFLPRMYLALENVARGTAHVYSVSLREDLGGGNLGPEMMLKPSMAHHLYIPEEKAHSLDRILERAERNGVYLKLVLMDLNDKIYFKMADDGAWSAVDNQDGFYGLGRAMNRTRWLQQMWWRYAQARWGYSPSVHSWELTNEGDPALAAHYELADEFGKYMHCRAFGVEPGAGDGARCALRHPNAHLVTTSFWSGFPAREFWRNARYPNVDYADVHAYVSTSFAPVPERQAMQHDAAYYHTWHSRHLASMKIGKPIVRGEGGLDAPDRQSVSALGLERDTTGVWLHNFLWSSLDSGALHEVYWWREHILDNPAGILGEYRAVGRFVADIPLNKGGYTDWGGTVSSPSLRVVGQKNVATGALHLWVQNRAHTWKNVVDGADVPPASGSIVVPGFTPRVAHTLERWDTHAPGGAASVENLVADSAGRLTIDVVRLWSDVAFKVRAGSAAAGKKQAAGT